MVPDARATDPDRKYLSSPGAVFGSSSTVMVSSVDVDGLRDARLPVNVCPVYAAPVNLTTCQSYPGGIRLG
jgi:hypothetical protein